MIITIIKVLAICIACGLLCVAFGLIMAAIYHYFINGAFSLSLKDAVLITIKAGTSIGMVLAIGIWLGQRWR